MTLPTITPDLPGIGGTLKQTPEHFVVEEIPLYEASGDGDHLYVNLTRRGWNTRDVVTALARIFGLHADDIGFAGLKDRQALTTQTFSLLRVPAEDAAIRIGAELPFQVNWVSRHRNKLRTGHLLGNRFAVFVAGVAPDALPRAEAIAAALRTRGLPNFFGVQRFGQDGDNALRGREALLGRGPRQRWLRRFLISAFQSDLFNRYLVQRINLGAFDHLLAGDVAKKHGTGGLFVVEDLEREQPRFQAGEISFTGPLFGAKMKAAAAEAAALEADIWAQAAVPLQAFKKADVDGGRRLGRLLLEQIELDASALLAANGGLWLRFTLPKGAYATVVLREFMKNDVVLGEEDESDEA